jgi:hypothetical protein
MVCIVIFDMYGLPSLSNHVKYAQLLLQNHRYQLYRGLAYFENPKNIIQLM